MIPSAYTLAGSPPTRPKPPAAAPQDDLFRARLQILVDPRHALVRLAGPIEWEQFEMTFGAVYTDTQRLAHDYMTGDCPHCAIALHRQNGWPMRGVVDRDPAGPHLRVMHVWAVRPDGMAVDAEGAKDEASLVAHYVSRHGGAREDLTEAEILSWYAFAPEDEGRWASPREWEPWVPLEARWMASVLEPDADPRPAPGAGPPGLR